MGQSRNISGYNDTEKIRISDLDQIHEQMKNRPNNGLIDYELQEKLNDKNIKRSSAENFVEMHGVAENMTAALSFFL